MHALAPHTPQPDGRLMERLVSRIRSRDGSAASWIAGGEALAMGLLLASRTGELPLWASDLADTMVGSLLRVLDRSLDEATVDERIGLSLGAVVLSVARPHCTSVLDGAVDAWLGWTPEREGPQHGEHALSAWTLLHLLRDNLDGAAHTAWTLAEVDRTGLGMILHDWSVARIQTGDAGREVQCFHAFRTALARLDQDAPTLLIAAAAVAVKAGEGRRREVLPWLRDISLELERDGTARVTPTPARRTRRRR